jgi:hypothetical protein
MKSIVRMGREKWLQEGRWARTDCARKSEQSSFPSRLREWLLSFSADAWGAKISIIRNASALNTNHTTMLVARHGEIRSPTLCLWACTIPGKQSETANGYRARFRTPVSCGLRMHRIGYLTIHPRSSAGGAELSRLWLRWRRSGRK